MDYALVSQTELDAFVCIKTVATLLKHGADPNRLEIGSAKSPWQNALCNLDKFCALSRAKDRWALTIELLLKVGADPHAVIPSSLYGTVSPGRLYSLGEVIGAAFQEDPPFINHLQMVWDEAGKEASTGSCTNGHAKTTERAKVLENVLESSGSQLVDDLYLRIKEAEPKPNVRRQPQSVHGGDSTSKPAFEEAKAARHPWKIAKLEWKSQDKRTRKSRRVRGDVAAEKTETLNREKGGCCLIQ